MESDKTDPPAGPAAAPAAVAVPRPASIPALAAALQRLDAVAEQALPADFDLAAWLDTETALLAALAGAAPADRDELLLKARLALARLLRMVEEDDRSADIVLARAVLADLQAPPPAPVALPEAPPAAVPAPPPAPPRRRWRLRWFRPGR